MSKIEIVEQDEIEIEEIPLIDEPSFKKVEKPKKEKTDKKGFKNLLSKIRFIKKIQKAEGYNYNAYCMLSNMWLAARNDMVQIAIPVHENINCCPKTFLLFDAVNTLKTDFQMVALHNSLQVDNENMTINIPCTDYENLSLEAPDQITFGIDNNFKETLKTAALYASKKDKDKFFNCFHFDEHTIITSNNIAISQLLHNVKFPHSFKLKLKTIKLIIDYPYELKSIGITESSITFYFADNGFIKCWFETIEQELNLNEVFSYSHNFKHLLISNEFRQAIAPFKKYVFFKNDKVSSKIDEENATIYNYSTDLNNIAFNAPDLYNCLFCSDHAILDLENNKLLVVGDKQRCCITTLEL